MNEKEFRLKILEREVVHCETFELACKVCERMDDLGERWCTGDRYTDKTNYTRFGDRTCYNIHNAGVGPVSWYEQPERIIISAVEWLNRHGIFVYGQEINCGWTNDNLTYIGMNTFVAKTSEDAFRSGEYFKTSSGGGVMKSTSNRWAEIFSITPFVQERTDETYSVTAKEHEKIKAILNGEDK